MEPILRTFADNDALVEAVRKYLLSKFSVENSAGLVGLDDKSIGEVIRARLDGRAKVEQAFMEIRNYRTLKSKEVVGNPAR